jgi:hypothetical protein
MFEKILCNIWTDLPLEIEGITQDNLLLFTYNSPEQSKERG